MIKQSIRIAGFILALFALILVFKHTHMMQEEKPLGTTERFNLTFLSTDTSKEQLVNELNNLVDQYHAVLVKVVPNQDNYDSQKDIVWFGSYPPNSNSPRIHDKNISWLEPSVIGELIHSSNMGVRPLYGSYSMLGSAEFKAALKKWCNQNEVGIDFYKEYPLITVFFGYLVLHGIGNAVEYEHQQLVSVLDEIRKKGEEIAAPSAEETFYTELSQEDNMLIAEFNSILEDRFEPMHRLTAAQQNIVLALYHGKSVACNAPSGSMKNVMLYLLALKEHQSNGKQTLLTAEAHLQENELVLADRLGLKGGIISTMAEFLADYKKDKYDIIFVSYEFFRKHENIAPFVDYFTNKVAYWGLDHPASAQDIWMQLNNCGVALDAVMFLMDKVGFGDLNLSNYQRIDIAGTADLGVVKKHTLFAPEEKLRWILANLDELSGQGLIYCDDEVTCKSLSKSLRKNKVMAEAYIDVNNPEKKEHINYLTNAFTSGGLPILVTTHEAGKNLSNPHIRFIIHYDIPEDQELYQLHATQIGRQVTDAVVHDLLVV